MLSKNQVCVEVCPLSNVMTGATHIAKGHSLQEFLNFEVPFVVCSDNPGIQETSLIDDYDYCNKEIIIPNFPKRCMNIKNNLLLLKETMKIHFLSNNPNKIKEINDILGDRVEVVSANIKIEEIQSKNTQDLVRDKLLKAFKQIGRPYL